VFGRNVVYRGVALSVVIPYRKVTAAEGRSKPLSEVMWEWRRLCCQIPAGDPPCKRVI